MTGTKAINNWWSKGLDGNLVLYSRQVFKRNIWVMEFIWAFGWMVMFIGDRKITDKTRLSLCSVTPGYSGSAMWFPENFLIMTLLNLDQTPEPPQLLMFKSSDLTCICWSSLLYLLGRDRSPTRGNLIHFACFLFSYNPCPLTTH